MTTKSLEIQNKTTDTGLKQVEQLEKNEKNEKNDTNDVMTFTNKRTASDRAQAVRLRTYQREGETWTDTCHRVRRHLIWQYKKGTKRELTKTHYKEIDELMDLIYKAVPRIKAGRFSR